MDDKRSLMRHFLAALAYRTQKALRGIQPSFASFRAAPQVRTPHELVRHMSGVLNYARTFFEGDPSLLDTLSNFEAEIARFHQILEELGEHLLPGTPLRDVTPEQLLQGPFADAMTHAGQLAMLRRLAETPYHRRTSCSQKCTRRISGRIRRSRLARMWSGPRPRHQPNPGMQPTRQKPRAADA
jgi:hypothetical protein